MSPPLTRREFLRTTATGLALAPVLARAAPPRAFSFVLLGDLHFDRLEHHDLAWVEKSHAGDVRQIQDYSRITRELMPRLFGTVRDTVAALKSAPDGRVPFVLHVGDLVEGLCGDEERAVRQNTEALAFVREARLGAPFLFTKGNHDITGPGAPAAFAQVFHPFLTDQAQAVAADAGELRSARYTIECGHAQFVFFDAYDAASLAWFEAVAARRTAEHFFVVVHPPVVPYGARSTWHVFAGEKEKAKREKFLALLGAQRALVLGGHIHKFSAVARTAGRGRFAQLAVSSVVGAAEVTAQMPLSGPADYTGDQIRVEPQFSPETEAARRAVYDAERPFVKAFEYADLPGYAVVSVDGPQVTARIYSGVGRHLWRAIDLTELLTRPA